ncbi:MAG: hypothetical protein ACM3W4_11605 [Ignavibacteriales bacterium]
MNAGLRAALCVTIALSSAGSASAQTPSTAPPVRSPGEVDTCGKIFGVCGEGVVHYIVETPHSDVSGDRIARPGEWLLVQPLYAERAVRLDGEAKAFNFWGRGRKLPAGTPLFAAFRGQSRAFCAVAGRSSAWGITVPCLLDTDHDGKFDSAQIGVSPGALVGVAEDGTVTDFSFRTGAKRLAKPVPYSEIPYDQGPEAAVRYQWKVKFSKDARATLSIWTNLGSTKAPHSRADGEAVTATLGPDGAAVMNVDGAMFTIQRLDPDGTLHYRVDPAPRTSGPVHVEPEPITVIVYY